MAHWTDGFLRVRFFKLRKGCPLGFRERVVWSYLLTLYKVDGGTHMFSSCHSIARLLRLNQTTGLKPILAGLEKRRLVSQRLHGGVAQCQAFPSFAAEHLSWMRFQKDKPRVGFAVPSEDVARSAYYCWVPLSRSGRLSLTQNYLYALLRSLPTDGSYGPASWSTMLGLDGLEGVRSAAKALKAWGMVRVEHGRLIFPSVDETLFRPRAGRETGLDVFGDDSEPKKPARTMVSGKEIEPETYADDDELGDDFIEQLRNS